MAANDRASKPVRAGLVVLAVPQVVTGAWALAAPGHWFDTFPGVGPALVAAEPPFNAHLAADAGAGFLATGAALAIAAVWAGRQAVVVALATYLVFATAHLAYHAHAPAPGLTPAQNAANVVLLAAGVALALLLLWGSTRSSART